MKKFSEQYDLSTPKGKTLYHLDTLKCVGGLSYHTLVLEKVNNYFTELEACKYPFDNCCSNLCWRSALLCSILVFDCSFVGSAWSMEPKPEKKTIFGSELRYGFIPTVRWKEDEEYHESPAQYDLPILVICSALTPNLGGKSRSMVSKQVAKKDLLLRGELVKASDQKLYVFVAALGVFYPPFDPAKKFAFDFVEWCPEAWLDTFQERGVCYAALWRGGGDLLLEVSAATATVPVFIM